MKSDVKRKIGSLLNSVRLRRTGPRAAILGVLLGARRPQTAEQIAVNLAPAAPDKVTIYRTLESLVAAGLVHKVFLQERTWHFELARNCTESQCHPHFTCTNCGDMHCLTEMSLPMAKSPHKGFVIGRQRVQLEGLCPKCNPNL
jgi:Fe2+ or Zn2+ uptake regulation protein